MSGSTESSQISVGDDVYGSEGDKVGAVAEVQRDYIVVAKGQFFPTDYFIPRSAIDSVSNGQVYLNVAKDAALRSGWDTVPEGRVATGMTAATVAMGEEEIRERARLTRVAPRQPWPLG